MQLSTNFKKWIVCAIVVAVAGFCCVHMSVNSRDPHLKTTGLGIYYNDTVFSGILYDFFAPTHLRQIALVWHGRKLGTEYNWYASRQLESVRSYKDGLPDGVWKQWYPNGSVKSYRQYVAGVNDGEYWVWHENGVVSDFRVYDMGREVAYKSFITDGKPFYNYVYQDGKRVGLQGGDYCKTKSKR